MRKILLFAVLSLTLTLLPTVPIAAVGPPPKGEIYLVTFTGPDIKSEPLELMSSGASGKGGKHIAFYTPSGEHSSLTFIGGFWGIWEGSHEGGIRLSIDLKFKEAGMVYFFDHVHEPSLDFWRLINTDEGKGEWIADEGKACFSVDPFEIWLYSNQGDITTLDLTFNVTIEPKPEKPEEGKAFSPNYAVTFAENVEGTGLVEVKGYFADISSNVAVNDVELTFSSIFGGYGGPHFGYLHMERTSKVDPTIEIFYTYGPENDLFYHLHGFGSFEGDRKAGWFTIDTTGYEFTLSESVGGEWITVWTGGPSFTVTGEKI